MESWIEEHIIEHFNHLFTAIQSNSHEVIECIERKVSLDQNKELLCQVTKRKVKDALFQMNPDKSPGPDGMTLAFYQKHWSILGDDIFEMVSKFFQVGTIPIQLNETNIVLIRRRKTQ